MPQVLQDRGFLLKSHTCHKILSLLYDEYMAY